MQQKLIDLEYLAPGEADGDFGTKTYNVVTQFQKAQGIGIDGIVGKQTLIQLQTAMSMKRDDETEKLIEKNNPGSSIEEKIAERAGETDGKVCGGGNWRVSNIVHNIGQYGADLIQGIGAGMTEGRTFGVSDKLDSVYARNNEVVYTVGKVIGNGATAVISGSIAAAGAFTTGGLVASGNILAAVPAASATYVSGTIAISSIAYYGSNVSNLIKIAKSDGNNGASKDTKPTIKYPGNDSTKAPGEGWEWRGKGDPGSKQGSWYNPKTGESLS